MGLLRDQASRLIRTKWGSNVDLAMEELFAIFTGDVPITFDSPVTIVNNSDSPALQIRDFGDSDSVITINKRKDPPPDFPEFPPPDFDDVGRQYVRKFYYDGNDEEWDGDGGNPPDTTRGTGQSPNDSGGGGGVFPGQVTGGSGDTYTVDVYEDGLSAAPTSRSVKQLSIASGVDIPAGTWAIVGSTNGEYFMQVPVWLENPS